jgi:hypothetical protein
MTPLLSGWNSCADWQSKKPLVGNFGGNWQ